MIFTPFFNQRRKHPCNYSLILHSSVSKKTRAQANYVKVVTARAQQIPTIWTYVCFLLVIVTQARNASAQSPDVLANDRSGYGRIYYESLEDDKSSFNVNHPFRISYATPVTSNVSWVPPPTCTVTTAGANNEIATAICSQSGIARFQVFPDNDQTKTDAFYVTITEEGGCYRWTLGTRGSEGTSDSILRPHKNSWVYIWVVDWNFATDAERGGWASTPSEVSARVSNAMYHIGETPQVTFSENSKITDVDVLWSDEHRYWIAKFTTVAPGQFSTSITGNGISILNCRIRPSILSISVEKYASAPVDFMETEIVTPQVNSVPFSVVQDPCATNVQFAVGGPYLGSGPYFAYSQGGIGWSSTSNASTFSNAATSLVQSTANLAVSALAPTYQGVTFLTTDAQLLHADLSGKVSLISPPDAASITRLKLAFPYCDTMYLTIAPFNSFVLAWDHQPGESTIYLSGNDGETFFAMNPPYNAPSGLGTQGFIRDIVLNPVHEYLIVLVRDNADGKTPVDRVVLWDNIMQTWMDGYVFPNLGEEGTTGPLDAGIKGSKGGVTIAATTGAETFAWGDGLYYSPDGGRSFFDIALSSRDPLRPAVGLANDEYVDQLVTSNDGNFAALTSKNRMFYGKIGLSTAIELMGGLTTTDVATISFDNLGRLCVHTPDHGANGYVATRIVPAGNQLVSPRAPLVNNVNIPCPYVERWSNVSSVYYLDIGESLNFTVSLLPKSDAPNTISVTYSNSSILDITTTETELRTVSLITGGDGYALRRIYSTVIQPKSKKLTGQSDVRIIPNAVTAACDQVQEYSKIFVSCPPTRRMVFRSSNMLPAANSSWDCSLFSDSEVPTSISLPANDYTTDYATMAHSGPAKDIPYNCSLLGPPERIYYGSTWRPNFDIYDGDTFVKTVDADFVVFEENGKRSYVYNSTMKGVGCIRQAQTWATMIQANTSAPFDSWSESNYMPCDQGTPAGVVSSDTYEIFNGRIHNGIIWTGGLNGIYVFSAKVLDPDFSYCTLSTQFSITVYGAPLDVGVQAGIVLLLTATVLGVLVASYFWYRREHTTAKDKDQ